MRGDRRAVPPAMSRWPASLLAVDLAAKFSAACLMTGGKVTWQCDSWQKTESDFIDLVTGIFDPDDDLNMPPQPDVLVIEDLPHGVKYLPNVKDVCRLQGRIVERMHSYNALGRVLFTPPNEWRHHYGESLKRGTGPDAVVPVAASLGYTPPDLTGRTGKGEKATARKVATDYCAAFLIARWAQGTFESTGTYDQPRTSRYTKV